MGSRWWGLLIRGESRSEEHTSELQSHLNLVCRLLLEKKKSTHDIAELSEAVSHLLSLKPHQTHATVVAAPPDTPCRVRPINQLFHAALRSGPRLAAVP